MHQLNGKVATVLFVAGSALAGMSLCEFLCASQNKPDPANRSALGRLVAGKDGGSSAAGTGKATCYTGCYQNGGQWFQCDDPNPSETLIAGSYIMTYSNVMCSPLNRYNNSNCNTGKTQFGNCLTNRDEYMDP